MSVEEILVCPACRAALEPAERDDRRCTTCGRTFATLRGVPVLMADADLAAIDLAAEGGPLPTYDSAHMGVPAIDAAFARGDAMLELGAGLDVHRGDGLVKTDAYIYGGADLDLVADAHALPFADASFDFVFSLAVFEHLHSPWQAAREIARVLRPGGRAYTLAAFLQPLHGYPDHYFNATERGLARLFADDFDVEHAGPSRHCPHRESVVPLQRMIEMTEALRAAGPPSRRARVRAWRLRRALRRAGHEYLQLADAMLGPPDGHAAWRRIAPAVEVTAVRRAPAA